MANDPEVLGMVQLFEELYSTAYFRDGALEITLLKKCAPHVHFSVVSSE